LQYAQTSGTSTVSIMGVQTPQHFCQLRFVVCKPLQHCSRSPLSRGLFFTSEYTKTVWWWGSAPDLLPRPPRYGIPENENETREGNDERVEGREKREEMREGGRAGKKAGKEAEREGKEGRMDTPIFETWVHLWYSSPSKCKLRFII